MDRQGGWRQLLAFIDMAQKKLSGGQRFPCLLLRQFATSLDPDRFHCRFELPFKNRIANPINKTKMFPGADPYGTVGRLIQTRACLLVIRI